MTTGFGFADLRRTVTVLVPVATGDRDAYGNPVYTHDEVQVPDCLFAPGSSQDDQDDADRTVTSGTLYDLNASWPSTSAARVRFDNSQWEITGEPQRWPGNLGGVVVEVRKVDG